MNSLMDDLQEENRILRDALVQIANGKPMYEYASGSSHPDTNAAWSYIWKAQRALRDAALVSKQAAGGSE